MKNVEELFILFQKELDKRELLQQPVELYAPINYIMQLGGKRLRPILLLMTYELFRDDVEYALPAAYAIEMFHNFSLVHDDIMDEAELRRGKPTVHHKYNVNTGILSGDVMLIYTYKCLMELSGNPNLDKILRIFNQVAIDVCEGQQMDMNFEERLDVRLSEYLQMIEMKTAALLAGALQIGALAAGASQQDAQHAYEFGRNIGIAFQLQDDLLDSFGDPEKFGKKVGGDIVQNKKTFLVLKSLELGNEDEKEQLLTLLAQKEIDETSKIEAVKAIFESLKIPEQTSALKNMYQQKALSHLKGINVSDWKKNKLQDLTNKMLGREV